MAVHAMRNYCWERAHKSQSPKWRTFWFNQFDVLDGLLWVSDRNGGGAR
jgi:hypothetical protein